MDAPGHWSSLDEDDALSLWVGRVAREHARLEYTVDNIYRFLACRAGQSSDATSMKGFDQLARECTELLGRSGAAPDVVVAGREALTASRRATGERNRVVHDMWLPEDRPDSAEPQRWNAFRRASDIRESYDSARSRDLASVVDTHCLIVRTQIRVSGLFMALHATCPPNTSQSVGLQGEATIARYVSLMQDRFTLRENGDVDIG